MSLLHVSRAIGTHDDTVAPEVTRAERDPVLDLVRAWEDSDPHMIVGRISREALIRRIIRHTRQAVAAAERPLREALDANDIGECRGCGKWVNRTTEKDDIWVDSAGLFCNLRCARSVGAVCACGAPMPVDAATCERQACVERFAAEVQQ